MAVQYTPFPEFQTPNVNLLGAYAQGQALQQNALQQQRLEQQMKLAELTAGYAANKDVREAAKLQAEQQAKEFETASKKYDMLVGMSPRLTPQNYKAWYKEVVTTFPSAASVLNPEFDPEQVKLIPLQAADMKPQLLQQTIGDKTRLLRAGPTGGAEVVPGSEMAAAPKYTEIKDSAGNIVGYRPERGMGGMVSPEEFQGGNYMDYMQGREGTGKNPRSSAQGMGQFIDSTFVDTYRKVFPDRARNLSRDQILAQRGTKIDGVPVEQPMLEAFTAGNQQRLQDAGFAPTKGNTYLSHFLGADGAIDVLSAPKDTPVSEILSPKAIKANPEVFAKAKTAGDLIKWAGGGPLEPTSMKPLGTSARAAQDSALNILSDLDIDEEGGDRVSNLINKSTSGLVQTGASEIPRATLGWSTPGRKAIANLKVLANEYTLEKLNNKLGAGFSNEDREFVAETMGNIANPLIPASERLSAWQEVKHRLAKHANVQLPSAKPVATAPSRGVAGETKAAKSIKRRGTYEGRPVVEYDDGTVDYAD